MQNVRRSESEGLVTPGWQSAKDPTHDHSTTYTVVPVAAANTYSHRPVMTATPNNLSLGLTR